jgi:hypothetical protein
MRPLRRLATFVTDVRHLVEIRRTLAACQGSRFFIKENPADAGQGWTKSWRHSMPKGCHNAIYVFALPEIR